MLFLKVLRSILSIFIISSLVFSICFLSYLFYSEKYSISVEPSSDFLSRLDNFYIFIFFIVSLSFFLLFYVYKYRSPNFYNDHPKIYWLVQFSFSVVAALSGISWWRLYPVLQLLNDPWTKFASFGKLRISRIWTLEEKENHLLFTWKNLNRENIISEQDYIPLSDSLKQELFECYSLSDLLHMAKDQFFILKYKMFEDLQNSKTLEPNLTQMSDSIWNRFYCFITSREGLVLVGFSVTVVIILLAAYYSGRGGGMPGSGDLSQSKVNANVDKKPTDVYSIVLEPNKKTEPYDPWDHVFRVTGDIVDKANITPFVTTPVSSKKTVSASDLKLDSGAPKNSIGSSDKFDSDFKKVFMEELKTARQKYPAPTKKEMMSELQQMSKSGVIDEVLSQEDLPEYVKHIFKIVKDKTNK